MAVLEPTICCGAGQDNTDKKSSGSSKRCHFTSRPLGEYWADRVHVVNGCRPSSSTREKMFWYGYQNPAPHMQRHSISHDYSSLVWESWTAQMQPLQSNQRMKSSGGFFVRQLNHKQSSSLACSTWKKWHCSTYHEFQPLQNALMQSSSLLRGPQVVLLLPRALPRIPATSLQHPHVSQVTKYYSPQRIWACCNGSFESEKTFSDMIAGAKDKIRRRRRRTSSALWGAKKPYLLGEMVSSSKSSPSGTDYNHLLVLVLLLLLLLVNQRIFFFLGRSRHCHHQFAGKLARSRIPSTRILQPSDLSSAATTGIHQKFCCCKSQTPWSAKICSWW